MAIVANGTSYELSGENRAEVVVLIHGLGLNRQIWQPYLPALSQNYRLLSYDLFGHGESASPARKPDLTVYSEQLLDLLDELSIERAVIVGFSLGGMINRRFAMDHGERVAALIIMNSPHERTPEVQQRVEKQAVDTATGGPAATLNAAIERWFSEEFRHANNTYIQKVRSWILANNPTDYAMCRQVLASGVIELIRPDPPINQPTLVITCENDSGSTPQMSLAIASEIADAQTIIVPGLKHMGLVEKPELFFAPILDFLATTLGSN